MPSRTGCLHTGGLLSYQWTMDTHELSQTWNFLAEPNPKLYRIDHLVTRGSTILEWYPNTAIQCYK